MFNASVEGLEKRGDPEDTEHQGYASEWITFRVNPRSAHERVPTTVRTRIGLKELSGESFNNSRYLGNFTDGRTGIVFPASYQVEEHLRSMEEKSPEKPWILPVFIRPVESQGPHKIFRAYLPDEWRLARHEGRYVSRDRFAEVEGKLHQLERRVERLSEGVAPEKVLIVIDYQNVYKGLQELGIRADVEDIVNLICRLGGPTRLDETYDKDKLVYIVDFFNPDFMNQYTSWENRGYHFERVECSQDDIRNGNNPTDQIVINVAQRELEKHRAHLDAFCLVSGDGHFHDLIRSVREMGLKALVASASQITNENLYIAANLFIELEKLQCESKD